MEKPEVLEAGGLFQQFISPFEIGLRVFHQPPQGLTGCHRVAPLDCLKDMTM